MGGLATGGGESCAARSMVEAANDSQACKLACGGCSRAAIVGDADLQQLAMQPHVGSVQALTGTLLQQQCSIPQYYVGGGGPELLTGWSSMSCMLGMTGWALQRA